MLNRPWINARAMEIFAIRGCHLKGILWILNSTFKIDIEAVKRKESKVMMPK